MNTMIRLRRAEAKFTKAIAAGVDTAAKHRAYQETKQELVAARAAWRADGRPRPGDTTVAVTEPLKVKGH